jgi:hypothetical protein
MKPTLFVRAGTHLFICGLLAFILGCKEDEVPAVWNPVDQGGATPVVTSVSPTGAAWSGLTPVVITGKDFSSHMNIYFGGDTGTIQNSSATQITVIPPLDTGSATIKVVNREGLSISQSPYVLYSPTKAVARLLDQTAIMNSFEVTANEDVYVHWQSNVYHIPPGGVQTLVGGTSFSIATSMRVNKDGGLYMTGQGQTRLYRMDLGTGLTSQVKVFANVMLSFDFGTDGKTVYAGGRRNLSILDTTLTVRKQSSLYTTDTIRTVRVYNGYVYVGVHNGGTRGIYRNFIDPDGITLGATETVFDWAQGPIPNAAINDITFDVNGNLYVATDNANPILIIHPDGTSAFLYPSLLKSPIGNFVWGVHSGYLYLNYQIQGSSGVGRVVLDANLAPLNMSPILGAPYYGRGS